MSLERYALAIAGPRDFLINLLINTLVPWWVLRGMNTVPLLGNPSVLTLIGPMGFILVSVTTLSGFLNGVNHRKSGRAGPPPPPRARWLGLALRTALVNGAVALAVLVAFILALAWLLPDIRVSKTVLIGFQAMLAASLGYAVQVKSVLQTRRW